MDTTESKRILRAAGMVAVLVATTVVAAGTPIVLAQHLTSDDPVPSTVFVSLSVDDG